ncbi:MAG: phage antirepressor [Selenomonadaceae bacterium]|nr:phage antirepressor [Selenomonadaceae bacterium]
MENQLQIFNNPDFGDIRVVVVNNEPWLVGKDAAIALGYSNPRKALADHVPDKFKKADVTIRYTSSNGVEQNRNVTLINEAGLYKLIMRSKLPNAEKFSDWTCGEVLPSIRKHGIYATDAFIEKAIANPDFAIKILAELKKTQAERDAALNQVALLEPKADYCDNVLLSDEHLTSELIAKEYGHSSIWLHNILVQFNIIFKRGRTYFLKAKFADQGYRISETVTLEGGKTVVNYYWTQKGRNFIYNFLKAKGIVPSRERPELMQDLF